MLLLGLGRALIPIDRPVERGIVALLAAITGVCGGVVATELGTTFNDSIVSIGVLGSLLLVARSWSSLLLLPWRDAALRAVLAGLPVGVAVAGKHNIGPFAVGLMLGFLVAPCPWWRRLALAAGFGAGVFAVAAILLGPWLLQVWRQTGNPIFPYLNAVFHSPLTNADSFWLSGYRPRSLAEILLLPLRIAGIGRHVIEMPFRDLRVAAAYFLVPALIILAACQRAGRPAPSRSARGYFFAAMALSYVCWMALFAYYRYLTSLEMLAPLMIVVAILRVQVARLWQHLATAVILLALVATSRPADYGHVAWGAQFVEVDVPALARPDSSVVLLIGRPAAFVIPSFPPAVRFLQLGPEFADGGDPTSSWHRRMQGLIDAHNGDLYAIVIGKRSLSPSRERLASYGLILPEDGCRPLETNLSRYPDDNLRFCSVARRAGAALDSP